MNEILFENKFRRDKTTFKEIFFSYFFCSPIVIVYSIISALYTVSFILAIISGPQAVKDSILVMLFILFGYAILFIKYFQSVKIASERDNEVSGAEGIDCLITVTNDEIISNIKENNVALSFDKLEKAYQTKNYIVVETKAKLSYILKKDSFNVGDADSFIVFLREKGIRIKGKKN